MKTICPWVSDNQLYIDYHDNEWGIPVHDDRKLFELLLLETFQAGLNWLTVLKKRENFRKAFDNFYPEIIAKYDQQKIQGLMTNEGIIRNRLKIMAAISNADSFLKIVKEYGSFDKFIWKFTSHKTITNQWKNINEIPSKTKESDEMSKELKKHGFKFVGSTICYAFMQATGIVNDHTMDCWRHNK
ncbi:MAG: DNA-3-methyladenine glycosylase I [Bacteroidetes bacterium]|nr:DNA-3-methyladenine glycosylase I [Bacteroidota bacterium]HET6243239.1 DNA-3-methyladenine glycosylase I [Bacteroidia bacterium]